MSRFIPCQQKEAVTEIETAIFTVGQLADLIVYQRARAGSDPNMQLTEQHLESVGVAIQIISEATFSRFSQLMEDMGVPA